MPIVTEAGFRPADTPDWSGAQDPGPAVLLAPGDDAGLLAPHLDRIALIGVTAPGFADGRAFSVARRLRALGFRGRLRAIGPLIADQWPLALSVGFDEVDIPESLAHRQPEADWRRALALRPLPPREARRSARHG